MFCCSAAAIPPVRVIVSGKTEGWDPLVGAVWEPVVDAVWDPLVDAVWEPQAVRATTAAV